MTGQRPPTVLGFDYGLRRVGVAVGNVVTSTAEALLTLRADDGEPDWDAVDRCVTDWRPGLAVVGVPYNMDGSPGELTVGAGPAPATTKRLWKRAAAPRMTAVLLWATLPSGGGRCAPWTRL